MPISMTVEFRFWLNTQFPQHRVHETGLGVPKKDSMRSSRALWAHVRSAQREKTDAHVVSFFDQIHFAPSGAKFF